MRVAILSCCFAAGCIPNLRVEDGAQITCLTSADCPQDFTCVDAVGRCIKRDALNSAAPAFTRPPEITPVAKRGSVVTLDFTVDMPLQGDPTVTFTAAGQRYAFELDSSESADTHYVYRFTVTDDVAPGVFPVLVSLVSIQGVSSNGLTAALIDLDFAPPALLSTTLAPSQLRAAATISGTFVLDEAVSATPMVTFERTGAALVIATVTGSATMWSFSYIATGAESEAPYAITVRASDAAGNTSDALALGEMVFDFSPPTLSDHVVEPLRARPGQVVRARLEVSEALAAGSHVVLRKNGQADRSFEQPQIAGGVYVYARELLADESGDYAVVWSRAEDLAGNVATEADLGSLTIDTLAPALASHTLSANSVTAVDTLTLTFSTTEPLAADPAVLLADVPLTKQSGSGAGPYVFALDVGTTMLAGPQPLFIELRDSVGNIAFLNPDVVTVDSRDPALVGIAFSPPAARLGQIVLLTVTVDEALMGSPTLTWQGADPGFAFLSQTGLNYTFMLDTTGMVGTTTFTLASVTITDSAGNSDAPANASSFTVDADPPLVTALATEEPRYSAKPGFDDMIIRFNVDHPSTTVSVSVNGQGINCDPYSAVSPNYTCHRPVTVGDAEGPAGIVVQAQDPAQNTSFASTQAFFDFTAPDLVTNALFSRSDGHSRARVADDELYLNRVAIDGGGLPKVSAVFSVDEALIVPPAPQITPSSGLVSVTQTSGFTYSVLFTQNGTEADGSAALLQATLTDSVGNTRLATLGTVRFDSSAPSVSAPAIAGFVHRRVPWGSEGAAPRYAVDVVGGALPLGHEILVLTSDNLGNAGLLASMVEDGANHSLALPSTFDIARVYVGLRDRAGNPSPLPLLVPNGAFVATFGGKVSGSTAANPHRYDVTTWTSPTRKTDSARTSEADASAIAAVVQVDASAAASATAPGDASIGPWINLTSTLSTGPSGRNGHGMAFDERRGVTVLFGGNTGSGQHKQDTWEWDGAAWHQVATVPCTGPTGPTGRSKMALAYDPLIDRVVMYGGIYGTNTITNETWYYDGACWALQPAVAPVTNHSVMMDFDPVRGKLVSFGGRLCLACTRNWNGAVPAWENPTPVASPPGRYDAGLATYPDGTTLVFGGLDSSPNYYNTTYTYDGSTWSNVTPAMPAQSPSARHNMAITYDPARQNAVVFGGQLSIDQYGDTFAWTGTQWQAITSASAPSPRQASAMQRDALGRVILFGGFAASNQADTWLLLYPEGRRPGSLFTFALSGMQVAQGDVVALHVKAVMGGTGFDAAGSSLHGAKLEAFDVPTGKWTALGQVSTATLSERLVDVTDATTARRYVDPLTLQVLLRVVSDGRASSPGASVSVDYIELGIDYAR